MLRFTRAAVLFITLGMSSSLLACDAPADPSVDPIGDDDSGFTDGLTDDDTPNPPDGAGDDAPVTATVETVGDGSGVAHPDVELPPASRYIKRLTVDMLADSQTIVAGTRRR